MNLYLVRAGRHGEREKAALDGGFVTGGWNELPDLSDVQKREELEALFTRTNPDLSRNQARNYIGQIWIFIHEICKGDLVALPLRSRSAIAVGEVTGDYEYNKKIAEGVKHLRKVRWLKIIPRSDFDQDLLYSFGAFMTVCKIKRNNAVERIQKLLKGEQITPQPATSIESELEAGNYVIDLEQFGRDQISYYIARKFKGHALARLVEAVLKAEDYYTFSSSPGPDGGVDILAAKGSLGFDQPKICVQVKSSDSPVDVRTLRELQGVMTKVRAEHGLLVAWGGYNSKTEQEAKDAFFSIRLWDSADLIDAILKHYEKFSDELKAELPLKRTWSLVWEA